MATATRKEKKTYQFTLALDEDEFRVFRSWISERLLQVPCRIVTEIERVMWNPTGVAQ